MTRKFTQLLTLHDINTESIDLLADAYGYGYQYHQIITFLSKILVEPDKKCVNRLLDRIDS